MIIVVIS